MRFWSVVTKCRKCRFRETERKNRAKHNYLCNRYLHRIHTCCVCKHGTERIACIELNAHYFLGKFAISLSLSVLYSVYETLYAHINTDCAQANKFIRWKSLITNTARGEQKAKRKKQTLNGPKMYRYTFAIHNVKYTTHIARCTVHTYIQYLQSWSTDVQKNCTHVKYVISE